MAVKGCVRRLGKNARGQVEAERTAAAGLETGPSDGGGGLVTLGWIYEPKRAATEEVLQCAAAFVWRRMGTS